MPTNISSTMEALLAHIQGYEAAIAEPSVSIPVQTEPVGVPEQPVPYSGGLSATISFEARNLEEELTDAIHYIRGRVVEGAHWRNPLSPADGEAFIRGIMEYCRELYPNVNVPIKRTGTL